METKTLETNPAVAAGVYCGPATVLEVGDSSLKLQLPGRQARAELALAYPYEPQRDDLVLALSAGDGEVYVVGVLQGKGRTRLCVEGDLQVEASGRLSLRGHAGVAIESPQVTITAERYQVFARSMVERLGNAYRWARGAVITFAGRTRTVVERDATLTAGRIVEKAKQDVVIDGEKIRLG